MHTYHSPDHALHHGNQELYQGQMVPCFELPRRAELVLAEVVARGLGAVLAPQDHGLAALKRIHSARYLRFLEGAWAEWSALGRTHDALPMAWPVRGMNAQREPVLIDAKLGFYALDGAAPIQAGTWRAVRSSANCALSAAQTVSSGAGSAFALCRPPGHHAAPETAGGYCYLNNAALAAQFLRDGGAARVAVLDVDYHHGNGTQTAFYARNDVLVVNIHADPALEYPFYLGYSEETGEGAGAGFNLNLPLPYGTDAAHYLEALEHAAGRIRAFAPEALVVSLGVDTFSGDPISQFRLESADFLRLGERIAALGCPTVFVMEGGYAVEAVGVNAVNVLEGFEARFR